MLSAACLCFCFLIRRARLSALEQEQHARCAGVRASMKQLQRLLFISLRRLLLPAAFSAPISALCFFSCLLAYCCFKRLAACLLASALSFAAVCCCLVLLSLWCCFPCAAASDACRLLSFFCCLVASRLVVCCCFRCFTPKASCCCLLSCQCLLLGPLYAACSSIPANSDAQNVPSFRR